MNKYSLGTIVGAALLGLSKKWGSKSQKEIVGVKLNTSYLVIFREFQYIYLENANTEDTDEITSFLQELTYNTPDIIDNGVNFEVINAGFDGTNSTLGEFSSSNPVLIYSKSDEALIYDDNGSSAGYTILLNHGNASASNDIVATDIVLV